MKKTSKMKTASEKPTMHKNVTGNTCMCASYPMSTSDWGFLALRLVAGVFFLLHGLQKLLNMGMVTGFFSGIGIPGWMAWLVAITEALGGLLLIAGFWTRWASYVLAVIMVGALGLGVLSWGWFGWLLVVATIVSLASMCGSTKTWAMWIGGIVFTILFLGVLWASVKSGINPQAGAEMPLLYLASLIVLSMSGSSCYSMHSKCGCCE